MISKKAAEALLEKNIIVVDSDISARTVDYISESFGVLYLKGSPDILILIDSDGGIVQAGLDIYDILRLYPGKKTAIVTRAAFSMAAIILQACEEKYATKHARILIHNINTRSIKLDVLRDETKLNDLRQSMEKDQKRLYAIIEKVTGKSLEEVRTAFAKDEPMTTDEAKEFGLIQGVWDKPLPK